MHQSIQKAITNCDVSWAKQVDPVIILAIIIGIIRIFVALSKEDARRLVSQLPYSRPLNEVPNDDMHIRRGNGRTGIGGGHSGLVSRKKKGREIGETTSADHSVGCRLYVRKMGSEEIVGGLV